MTDPAARLRALLTRLITDGAHHAQCADRSRIEESRLVHQGLAAGFHIAALYTADTLITGGGQVRGGHHVTPAGQAAARQLAEDLPADPGERAKTLADAIYAAEQGRP